jgi:hypothetical protein
MPAADRIAPPPSGTLWLQSLRLRRCTRRRPFRSCRHSLERARCDLACSHADAAQSRSQCRCLRPQMRTSFPISLKRSTLIFRYPQVGGRLPHLTGSKRPCGGHHQRTEPLLLAFTSHPTALELSPPRIGLPRLLSSRCRPSSLSLQRSDCHSGDPTRRTHRRLQR